MKNNKETNEKITQLQILEQNIQNFLLQKQTFQSQLVETDNALEELEKSKGNVYKIVGAIMISAEKDNLRKDLQNKKEILDLRIRSIEKQENQLKEKASKLQSEVLTLINPKEIKNV